MTTTPIDVWMLMAAAGIGTSLAVLLVGWVLDWLDRNREK